MQNKSLIISLVTMAVFFIHTTPSNAYAVIEKGSAKLDDTHTFYFITYAFGHEKYDYSLPGLTSRGFGNNLNALVYHLRTPEGLTVKDGRAVAMISSQTKKLGDQYIAPIGTSTTFTLAVLHEKSSSSSRANTLTVDSLPFLIGDAHSELKAHELKAYSVSATGTAKLDNIN